MMNLLSASLRAEPRLDLILRCSVCDQPIDPRDKTEVEVRLFGAKQYGVCICCGQAVEHSDQTRSYKNRWGKRYRFLKAREQQKCQQNANVATIDVSDEKQNKVTGDGSPSGTR